ncbi:SNF2-related protein [Teredinibacter purpureus]|uniref:SNF2-related protein n=1 Tax=Teredinibacter purpureus TaxID=2731756 RepID=UPI0006978875|nr:DEAD/DEAH box helicase [Teredinibacter purpureus]
MSIRKTYGALRYLVTEDAWELSDLEPHVAIRLKQLFPKIPKYSAGPFFIRANNDASADIKWFLDRYPLQTTPKDYDYLLNQSESFFSFQSDAEKILLPDWVPHSRSGLLAGQAFRLYQSQGLDFIEKVRQAILVDDIGLGKTYEGLGVALLSNTMPVVIVVEPHLQIQWKEKAESFINLRIDCPKGNRPYDLPSADIYLFRYTQLSGWVDVLSQGWVKSIVFDEIQQLRTGVASAKGAAAKAIIQTIDTRVDLTATPLFNYGIEAFNIIDAAIKPRLLGTREEFLIEWCTDDNGRRGIVKDPKALGAYLRESLVFLRRTKKDVGQEAKQTAPHLEWVDPNEKAVEDSEDLAKQLAMTTLTGSFSEAGSAAREFDMRLRQMTGIVKAKATASYVRMLVETGKPVLLFGWHREVYRIWEEELRDLNPLFYTGEETATQKERAKKAFINGESDILIMSLRSGAGADGIQHRSSTVVFGEFDWSPKVHEQCIGRLDRDGQEDEVFVFYVATEFGSDPVLIDVLGLKSSQSHGIVDPGKDVEIYQADPERIKKLAKAYLKSKDIDHSFADKHEDEDTDIGLSEEQLLLI